MSMSELNTQLEYLAETKEQIKTAITNKGQDITSSVPFREYVDKINNISTLQADTADANAKVGDIVNGKTAYVNGEKITGTLRESASVFFRAESVTLDDEFNIVKSQGPNNYSGERVVMSSGATGWTEIPYQTLADTIGVTAEKIVQGNTILGIEGTATTGGIDTSDANAIAEDILINKTAYVNGQKITGTLPLFPNTSTFTVSNAGVTNNIEDSTLDLTTINTTKQILDSNVSMNFNADYSDVATAIGLTAEKIAQGNTILGIEGTASTGGLDTSDATALTSDICMGKTAYVNGQKITGDIQEIVAEQGIQLVSDGTLGTYPDENQVSFISNMSSNKLFRENSIVEIKKNNSELANQIGLTPDIIKKGVTILGITGTYEATVEAQAQIATLTQENQTLNTTINDSNELAEDILGRTTN